MTDRNNNSKHSLNGDRPGPPSTDALSPSEVEKWRELKQKVSEGPHHPPPETLLKYAQDALDEQEDRLVADHIALCGPCAKEVLRLTWLEDTLEQPFIGRIRDLVSALSFPVVIESPSFAPVRRGEEKERPPACKAGDPLWLKMEAPEDGQIVVFHYCEETGAAEIVFPYWPDDNPNVSKGQKIERKGDVEGPPGRHGFKAIWAAAPLLDMEMIGLRDESARDLVGEAALDKLSELEEGDWQETVREYEVVEE